MSVSVRLNITEHTRLNNLEIGNNLEKDIYCYSII